MLYTRNKEVDEKISHYIAKNPKATLSRIAKDLGIEKDIARLYTERLLEEGVLLGYLEPEQPYMRFKVEKIEPFEDKVMVSDSAGNNNLSLSKSDPMLAKIKSGVELEVYEDHVEIK